MLTEHEPLQAVEEATGSHSSKKMAAGGYAIWEYRDEAWSLMNQSCAVGYEAGGPPSTPGRFDGEVVRKYCTPVLGPRGATPAG